MLFRQIELLILMSFASLAFSNSTDFKFPDGFRFGAGTSAFQVEGAWNTDGRGPDIWNTFTHDYPEKIIDGQNTDVTADSYHLYEADIRALKSLGVNHYRFSFSWSRILPDGTLASVNEAGIDYYNRLIDSILAAGIEPIATIFHFDVPQTIQNLGGFTNEIVVDYFTDYANLLFSRFGDRVKMWITINEPSIFCGGFHGGLLHPVLPSVDGVGEYLCGHNMLKAHASAYRLYKREYSFRFGGHVGIALYCKYFYSNTNNTDDVKRALDFETGWFANPIFGATGDYPVIMRQQIDANSFRAGLLRSRLPQFTADWAQEIRGSADFFGLNYYTSRFVELSSQPMGNDPSFLRDWNIIMSAAPEWKTFANSSFYAVPKGLGDLLRYIKKEYDNPVVLITENGCPDGGDINDQIRVEYYRTHLMEVLDVLKNDECNLIGYTAWSLIDNFELLAGFTMKFGLFSVNFTSPLKERTPKASASYIKDIISSRRIPSVH